MKSLRPDYGLFMLVMVLVLFGLVMVYSSSALFSFEYYGESHKLFSKQLIAAAIGLGLMLLLMRLDYHRLFYVDGVLLGSALILTALTLIPGLARGGRWLNLGPLNFQPTELLKLALILYMAASLTRKGSYLQDFSEGVLPYLIMVGVASLLALLQPDFGMALSFTAIVFFMLFIGGVRILHLLGTASLSLPIIYLLILISPYRLQRLISFLEPEKYSSDGGYQIMQSLAAIGSGGLFGKGLGEGGQKLFYLPAAYNDFIFSVTAEELGMVGALFIALLFVLLGVKGLKIALNAPDRFSKLLAAGCTFSLCSQAAINLGVSVGLLPVTGLTLPFVSSGGSSLIVSLAMTGILLNISRYKAANAPISESEKGVVSDERLSGGWWQRRPSLSGLGRYAGIARRPAHQTHRLYWD